jgi:hypothetical protein
MGMVRLLSVVKRSHGHGGLSQPLNVEVRGTRIVQSDVPPHGEGLEAREELGSQEEAALREEILCRYQE